jgi:hypothetical protein
MYANPRCKVSGSKKMSALFSAVPHASKNMKIKPAAKTSFCGKQKKVAKMTEKVSLQERCLSNNVCHFRAWGQC